MFHHATASGDGISFARQRVNEPASKADFVVIVGNGQCRRLFQTERAFIEDGDKFQQSGEVLSDNGGRVVKEVAGGGIGRLGKEKLADRSKNRYRIGVRQVRNVATL